MIKFVLLFLGVVLVACIAGWVRGTMAKPPRAETRPADDPAGGFASPQQLHDRLSAHAVRREGAQTRPGLPQPQAVHTPKRRGLFRVRR